MEDRCSAYDIKREYVCTTSLLSIVYTRYSRSVDVTLGSAGACARGADFGARALSKLANSAVVRVLQSR